MDHVSKNFNKPFNWEKAIELDNQSLCSSEYMNINKEQQNCTFRSWSICTICNPICIFNQKKKTTLFWSLIIFNSL